MLLRHEPTFDGLLSAIAQCLRRGVVPEALVPDLDQLTLLPCTYVATEPGVRSLFRRHLADTLGAVRAEVVYKTAYEAFLSDDEGIGLPICRYLAAALKRRADPSGDLLDKDIARVVRLARKTSGQSHVFLGLIRFRPVGSTLYLADFSPECHVLPLILPHFCERLPDQSFVIRDLRRGLAALHVPGQLPQIFVLAPPEFAATSGTLALPDTPDQMAEKAVATDPYHALWRRYLAVLTIPERRNLKLQRANMPRKYWKYLTEQPGGI